MDSKRKDVGTRTNDDVKAAISAMLVPTALDSENTMHLKTVIGALHTIGNAKDALANTKMDCVSVMDGTKRICLYPYGAGSLAERMTIEDPVGGVIYDVRDPRKLDSGIEITKKDGTTKFLDYGQVAKAVLCKKFESALTTANTQLVKARNNKPIKREAVELDMA